MLSKLSACVFDCAYLCAGLFVCVCVCAPSLCGSVTDRMRPLSRRCWGDNRYCSPRCTATALSLCMSKGGCCRGRARGVWTRTHRGPPMTASAVFFMIRDKIMSLQHPWKYPPWVYYPCVSFSVEEVSVRVFFLKIEREQCQRMSM